MREYTKGDEVRILEYKNSAVAPQDRRSLGYWEWQYTRNPSRITTIWIAEDGDTLAGHYALMPLGMKVGAETFPGAQSVDTFTHDEYRRLGIFTALAERVYSLAGEHGISVLYGFPSVAAYEGFVKKLGWIKVTSVEKMNKPLDITSLVLFIVDAVRQKRPIPLSSLLLGPFRSWCRIRRLLSRFPGASVTRIGRFGKEADDLWTEIASEISIRVVKDAKYLNWRYIDKPGNSYNVFRVSWHERNLGYIVVESHLSRGRFLRRGLVLDVITKTDEDTFRFMLYVASRLVRRIGGQTMVLWVSMGSWAHSILADETYLSKGRLILIAKQNLPRFNPEILRDSKLWTIMAGDTDVV